MVATLPISPMPRTATARFAVVLLGLVLLAPSGSADAEASDARAAACHGWTAATASSSHCRLDAVATLSVPGCGEGVCWVYANATSTGMADAPGLLSMRTTLLADVVSRCVGSSSLQGLTGGLSENCNQACEEHTLGRSAVCQGGVAFQVPVPEGACREVHVRSTLTYAEVETAVAMLTFEVCHVPGGAGDVAALPVFL